MNEISRYLSFMGSRVHYQIALPEEDTPVTGRILLLTSPLITTFHYRKLLPELNSLGLMAVSVDLPGFGGSDVSAPQGANMRAKILWGLLDAVDEASGAPMSSWHLLAHGTACATIMEMANLYPDSVLSQIHLSPMFTPPDGTKANEWLDGNLQDERRFRKSMQWLAAHPLDEYIMDRMLQSFRKEDGTEVFRRMLNAIAEPKEGLGFCPAFALWGGMDPLVRKERAESARKVLKGAEIHVLKSAGHFPMETHSIALCDYLRGWIRYIQQSDT